MDDWLVGWLAGRWDGWMVDSDVYVGHYRFNLQITGRTGVYESDRKLIDPNDPQPTRRRLSESSRVQFIGRPFACPQHAMQTNLVSRVCK